MGRERALKVVLVLLGLLFCAAVYPLLLMAKEDPALAMMMSLYATLGIFLLLAARNPSANRSLIEFTRGRASLMPQSWLARITTLDCSQGIGRVGRAYHHWRSLDRAGSHQAIYWRNRGGRLDAEKMEWRTQYVEGPDP
jgi:hypothetical protein